MKNILSIQAWEFLQGNANALLVDVRTPEEIAGGTPGMVLLDLFEDGNPSNINPTFVNQLKDQASCDVPLLFICRSGGRSNVAAALAEAGGFTDCYNVIDGMAGNNYGPGWLAGKLPLRAKE